MNRTKYIPSIVMLTAGFVICIVTFVNDYSLKDSLLTILCTMIAFLLLGCIIKLVIDKFVVLPMIQKSVEEAMNEDNVDDSEESQQQDMVKQDDN